MPVTKRTLLILACFISVMYACKKDGGGGLPGASLSFPMEVGNRWTYEITERYNDQVYPTYYSYWEIIREDTAMGKRVKVLRQIYEKDGNSDTCYEYLYQDGSALSVIATEGSPGKIFFKTERPAAGFFSTLGKAEGKSYPSPALVLLRYPAAANVSWKSYEFGTQANTTRAYAGQHTAIVPAGTFSANKVVISLAGGKTIDQYFTSRKGLVKESYTVTVDNGSGPTSDVIVSDVVLKSTNF